MSKSWEMLDTVFVTRSRGRLSYMGDCYLCNVIGPSNESVAEILLW